MLTPKISRAFFSLLRAGLWEKPVDLPGCFPLLKHEWVSLFQLAKQQTVEGLVFEGIQRLDADFLPELALLTKWLVRVEKIAQRNSWMNSMLQQQLAFFKEAGIEPLLLKGQGLAICYARPERRNCGDIDWYFQTKEAYRKANAVIQKKGLQVNYTPGFSTSYWWGECEVEHHSRMIDLYNPFCQVYLRRLQEKEKEKQMILPLLESPLCLPSPMLQSILVNAHILKHSLSFGIGIRQFCDAARVYFTYSQEIDGLALKKIYKRTGIEPWIYLLHEVLTSYIGLPKEYLPFEARKNVTADWVIAEIIATGNFGFHDERKLANHNRDKIKIWKNAKKYLLFAPMEVCSFPVVHFYSRFTN